MINPVTTSGLGPALESPGAGGPAKPGGTGFASLVEGLMDKVHSQQANADQAVQDLALGRTDSVHGVMLAVAKADLSFHLFLEIRNRLTEALQQIMQMQV